MKPSTILLIKIKNDNKSKKYYVKIKLSRYPTLEESDMYEFKMALLDKEEMEEYLLFVQNFKMMLNASRTLAANLKLHCPRTLLCGGVICQFDTLCSQV